MHLATTVGEVWILLGANLTPANIHDSKSAQTLIEELPEQGRFVLGDTHYNTPLMYTKPLSRVGGFW